MSGAAMQTSKSVQPSLIFLARSSCADVVGAGGLGRFGQVALGEHDHALRLADAVRQHDRAADDLVGLLGDRRPAACAISTVWSNFVLPNFLRIFDRLGQREASPCPAEPSSAALSMRL